MKHKELINQMTSAEKVSLLSGLDFWTSRPIKRLNVPSLTLADGPLGMRRQAAASDHLGLNPGLPATCYPAPSTIANSWDIELAEKVGQHIGAEAAALQVSVVLGPGQNIKRSPLCGRNFEYFSEDPLLSGKMAAAYIRGIQSNGISACPKHYVANNQELRRMHNDSILDMRTLHEIYLTGFEIAVKEGRPLSLMSAYNKINGVYANDNEWLLQDILRDKWGFEGFVVTDWGGGNDHVQGVIAGCHLEMPATAYNSNIELLGALENGTITEELLDKRVNEFLEVLFSIKNMDDLTSPKEFNKEKHHIFAARAAKESIVLLKNDNILPLAKGAKVAIIGDFADVPRYQGAGSSLVNATKLDSILSCIPAYDLQNVGYASGYDRLGNIDDEKANKACNLAKESDFVILFLGLDELMETEGLDREHMRIRQNQIDLLEMLYGVNQNIITVLSCGSAVEMPWIKYTKALVHGYLGGQAGAGAMLDILTGCACPSGKLAESYPISYEHTPAYPYFPGKEATTEYREGIFVGYRYYDTAEIPVQFPFGFGLSYTTFEYSDLKAGEASISFTVTNTGRVKGAEIAQLYVGIKDSVIFRPRKELKGFVKVLLEPGESKEVIIKFDEYTFRYFDVDSDSFMVEAGNYILSIGASSQDIRLSTCINIGGTTPLCTLSKELVPSYFSAKIHQVTDAEFSAALGREIPNSRWDKSLPITKNDTISQLYYAKSWIARKAYKIINRMIRKMELKGKPNLDLLFVSNMPFRAIAKMTNGAINLDMIDGLLKIVNRRFFVGISHFIAAWFRMRHKNKKFAKMLNNASLGRSKDI